MGVLVADSKTFNNGLILSNWVATIKGTIIGLEKTQISEGVYVYRCRFNIFYFVSQAAYESRKSHLQTDYTSVDLTEAQASGDIWAAIYDSIKSNYTSATDI